MGTTDPSAIVVSCDACGARMRVPAEHLGRAGKCGKCGARIVVGPSPAPPPENPSPPPPPPASPPPTAEAPAPPAAGEPVAVTCPSCGARMRVPPQYVGRPGKCGKCGARIAALVEAPADLPTSVPPAPSPAPPEPEASSPPCLNCGQPRGKGAFCPVCGHPTAPAPPAPAPPPTTVIPPAEPAPSTPPVASAPVPQASAAPPSSPDTAAPLPPSEAQLQQFSEWASVYLPSRAATLGHADFLFAPYLPEPLCRAIVSFYGSFAPGERVLVFYDQCHFRGDVTGIAKEINERVHKGRPIGVVFTDRRLLWLDDSDVHHAVPYHLMYRVEVAKRSVKVFPGGREETVSTWLPLLSNSPIAAMADLLQAVEAKLREAGLMDESGDIAARKPVESVDDAVLLPLQRHATARFLMAPEIPEAKLRNACESYLSLTGDERPLALFDDTVIGNAKSGFCLTDRRLVWRVKAGSQAIAYAELPALEALTYSFRDLTFTLPGRTCVMGMTQWGKADVKALSLALYRVLEALPDAPAGSAGRERARGHLRALAEKLGGDPELLAAPAGSAAAETPAPSATVHASVQEAVAGAFAGNISTSYYLSPDVPEKKLRNASEAYLHPQPGETVLALFDDTAFGSGGAGFCLTDRRLAWGGDGKAASLPYPELLDITRAYKDEGAVVFEVGDRHYRLEMTLLQKQDLQTLASALAAVFEVLARDYPDHPAAPHARDQLRGLAWEGRAAPKADLSDALYFPEVFETAALPEPSRARVRNGILRAVQGMLSPVLLAVPDIPAARVAGASESYLRLQPGEEVLVMFDNSINGSGRSGCCLTDRRLAWNLEARACSLPYSQFERFSYLGSSLVFGSRSRPSGMEFMELSRTQRDAVALALLCVHFEVNDLQHVELLGLTRGVLINAGPNRRGDSGALVIAADALVWNSDADSQPLRIELEGVTNIAVHPEEGRLSFRDRDGRRAEFELGEVSLDWADLIEMIRRGELADTDPRAALAETIQAALRPLVSRDFHLAPSIPDKVLKATARDLTLAPGERLLATYRSMSWLIAHEPLAFTDRRIVRLGGERFEILYADLLDAERADPAIVLIVPGAIRLLDLPWSEAAAPTIAQLALRLIDDLRRPREGEPPRTSSWRLLRAAKAAIVEVDDEAVEHQRGFLVLTNHELLWFKEEGAEPLVAALDFILSCSGRLLSRTFTVEFHARQSGLLGALGLANKTIGFQSEEDHQSWIAAIRGALEDAVRSRGA